MVEGDAWTQGDHGLFLMNNRPALAITSELAGELLGEITHTLRDRPCLWRKASENRMSADPLDFQTIYETYQPRIRRYLARLVGEPEAEDLAQEVFVKISQGLKTFRGESQFSTWLYRIATHAAIDKMRSASFRQEAGPGLPDESDETEAKEVWTGEEPPSLEQQLMRKEMYDCFVDFVKRLPPNYRTVVVLGELEQMPNNEIAEILGLSLEVVKIRRHRGRTRLLQELKTHCKAEDWL